MILGLMTSQAEYRKYVSEGEERRRGGGKHTLVVELLLAVYELTLMPAALEAATREHQQRHREKCREAPAHSS
jgi:hypothetical protein